MILTGKQVIESKIVRDLINKDSQEQMCGIDLTVAKIQRFLGNGIVDFDNTYRKLPEMQDVIMSKSAIQSGEKKVAGYRLSPGAYLVTFNETIYVPKDCMGIARPRSSLLRCGSTMETSVWDPGYEGRSQCMLVVHNTSGLVLSENAKVMQIVFMRVEEEVEKLYSGTYQKEGLNEVEEACPECETYFK
jgi:dUTP pyrophosphatase